MFFLILYPVVLAQEVRLSAVNEPLDKVLNKLNVELSFDSKAMSSYTITLNSKFRSPKEAIDYLLKDKPYVCQRIGNVYVISPKKESTIAAPVQEKKEVILSGILIDKENGERLPFAHLYTERGMLTSNENGLFSFKINENTATRLQIQYLGYNPIDTLLHAGSPHKLYLEPRPLLMNEIVVSPSSSAMQMQSGKTSGEIRINHSITRYMAGSGDNSVFNILRMMPGVRASGEPTEDLIVWGSGSGESKISFDGFTLFGLKGFSDNISFINPYMVKDIRLHKGGYDASYGNRTGSIVNITGIEGRNTSPSIKANISNLTVNAFGSVPVTNRSVLMAAYRQTCYNLYDVEALDPYKGKNPSNSEGKGKGNGGSRPSQNTSDVYIYPDYAFRDINIKYSGNAFEKDNYYISLYTANDDFDFSVARDDKYEVDASQNNHQYAGAAYYNKVWENAMSTKLLLSFSELDSKSDHITRLKGSQSTTSPEVDNHVENSVKEMKLNLSHNLSLGKQQQIEIGGEVIQYSTRFNEIKNQLTKPTIYLTDNILLNLLTLNAGIRADMIPNDKVYIQPRISGRYIISDNVTATASWGLYKQYLSRIPVLQESDNIEYEWQIQDTASMSSMHSAAGMAFSKNGFLASIEGYYKKNKNMLRLSSKNIYQTEVDITGIDIFLKKEFDKASIFGSYSITNISEEIKETGHELKLGSIVSLTPFTISANYIFGTGFSNLFYGGQGLGMGNSNVSYQTNKSYNRLDIAGTYNLKIKSCKLQMGLSVMNILGNQNIKYNYLVTDNKDVTTVYTKAMPFTPMLFVEILF